MEAANSLIKSLPRLPKKSDSGSKRTRPLCTSDESPSPKRGRTASSVSSDRSDDHYSISRPLSPQQRQSRPRSRPQSQPNYYPSLSPESVHGSNSPSPERRQPQPFRCLSVSPQQEQPNHRSPSPSDSLVPESSQSATSTSSTDSQAIASIVSAIDGLRGEVIK